MANVNGTITIVIDGVEALVDPSPAQTPVQAANQAAELITPALPPEAVEVLVDTSPNQSVNQAGNQAAGW